MESVRQLKSRGKLGQNDWVLAFIHDFNSETFMSRDGQAFWTCLGCVGDETNQQLTGPQKGSIALALEMGHQYAARAGTNERPCVHA